MSILGILGWIAVGFIATACLVTFWDNIVEWLNNVAADVVERNFGYKARDRMFRAVAKVDRVMDIVRNKSTIYTRKNELDTHYYKTDITAECPAYEIDNGVLEEIKKHGSLVQEFEYNK